MLLVVFILNYSMRSIIVDNALREATVNVDRTYSRLGEVLKLIMDISYKMQMDQNLEKLLLNDYKSTQEVFDAYYQYIELNNILNLNSQEIKEIKIYSNNTGQYYEAFDTLESIIALQSDVENDVLSHYGVKAWKELYPQASDFPVKTWGAAWLVNIDDPEWKAADDKILKTGYKMIPAAILAKPADFDAKWDAYQKALKDAGIDQVTATFTKALQDRSQLWK